MEALTQILHNKYIWVPFFTWFSIQVFKVIWDLIETRKLNFKRIMGAGGMPSSHSAVVTCLSTLVGRSEGTDSPIFAVALIFAMVVMYDAAGVRRAAGKQAACLNKIIMDLYKQDLQEAGGKLKELLGHTPMQVLVGAIYGISYATLVHHLLG